MSDIERVLPRSPTTRILHVDDELTADAVINLHAALEKSNCSIDTAGDISAAAMLLSSNEYDYVILDLVRGKNVAGMEFKEVIHYAKARGRPPNILIWSAYLGNCDATFRRHLDTECVGVFPKDDTQGLLGSILKRRGAKREHKKASDTRSKARRPVKPSELTRLSLPATTKPQDWRKKFRALWRLIRRTDIERRTALAVIHGIVERSCEYSLMRAGDWLQSAYDSIASGATLPARSIEVEARRQNCGLQVFDAERDPDQVTAFWGVVQNISDGIADISFYVRETVEHPEAPVMEAVEVPEVDMPAAYAKPGAWVAWVERSYKCGAQTVSKGRFEPSGTLPQAGEKAKEFSVRVKR